jgi:hypothetical protein
MNNLFKININEDINKIKEQYNETKKQFHF